MTGITKALPRAPQSRANLAISGVVLLLIAALFFVPELIDLQSRLGGSSETSPTREREEAIVTPSTARELAAASSPLSAVLDLVRTGSFQPQSAQRSETAADASLAAPSWDLIRSREVSETLRASRARAQEILQALPSRDSQLGIALLTYINGVNGILNGTDQYLEAGEAVRYLRSLDAAVTRALVGAGAERGLLTAWREASLGPLISQAEKARRASVLTSAFNPQLQLVTLGLTKVATPDGTLRGPRPFKLRVGFRARAEDVKQIVVYEGDDLVGELPLYPADAEGRVYGDMIELDGTRVITVRVLGHEKEVFQRSYLFYPQADLFPWDPASGNYSFPHKGRILDPGLDGLFQYRGSGGFGVTTVNGELFDTF